jgi:hypothetical protein
MAFVAAAFRGYTVQVAEGGAKAIRSVIEQIMVVQGV